MWGEPLLKSVCLDSPSNKPARRPRWTAQFRVTAEKPHLGIKSGQLLDLLPHLFSFLHSEPAPEEAETGWGLGLREKQRGASGGQPKPCKQTYALLLLRLVLLCAVIKQLLVHLHKQLQGVVDQPMDCPATGGKMTYRRPEPALRTRTPICPLLGGVC